MNKYLVAGIGSVRRRRRRYRGDLVALKLAIDNNIVPLDTPPGEKVGTITNKIAGSTLTLVDSDSDRFTLVGNTIYTGPTKITNAISPIRRIELVESQNSGNLTQHSQLFIIVLPTEFATAFNFSDPINSGLIVLL
jgi:hypothetical protein